jgi:hypothetical protein
MGGTPPTSTKTFWFEVLDFMILLTVFVTASRRCLEPASPRTETRLAKVPNCVPDGGSRDQADGGWRVISLYAFGVAILGVCLMARGDRP